MKRLTNSEANELLKKGKILRQMGPDNITLRKLWKDCYHFVNEQQKVSTLMDGVTTVRVLTYHSYYFEG
jgi:hypothetical protein